MDNTKDIDALNKKNINNYNYNKIKKILRNLK